MRLRSDTGAGQPVALIITRMATALAKIRPRRVLRARRTMMMNGDDDDDDDDDDVYYYDDDNGDKMLFLTKKITLKGRGGTGQG